MGRGISRGSNPDASQSGATWPRMRHGPICNAWPSVPRGRKNERQLQRMGRNLGTGRLRSNRGRTQKLFPRKFVQLESCRSLVLRLCIFSPFFPSPISSFHGSRGEDIRKIVWGILKSRNRGIFQNRERKDFLLSFLDLLATSLRCRCQFRRKGLGGDVYWKTLYFKIFFKFNNTLSRKQIVLLNFHLSFEL